MPRHTCSATGMPVRRQPCSACFLPSPLLGSLGSFSGYQAYEASSLPTEPSHQSLQSLEFSYAPLFFIDQGE